MKNVLRIAHLVAHDVGQEGRLPRWRNLGPGRAPRLHPGNPWSGSGEAELLLNDVHRRIPSAASPSPCRGAAIGERLLDVAQNRVLG